MTNSSKVLFSSMAAEAAHNGAQRYAPRMRKTLQPLPLHTESSAEAVWWRYGSWLTGATLVLCALAMCLPRMQLPAGYHDFADQVAWGVLPYARDVLTNLAFAIAGWVLLWQGMKYSRNMQDDAARHRLVPAVQAAAWGLVLTALCSGIYHLRPDAAGLAIDRIGMSAAFAGVVGLLVADRLATVRVVPAMAAALLLGVACVMSDFLNGNMTPWVIFQVGVSGLMLLAPWVTRRQGERDGLQQPVLGIAWWQVLVFYALAKLCEMGDQAVWQWTGAIISGHSLKHIVAAAAVWPVVRALQGTKHRDGTQRAQEKSV